MKYLCSMWIFINLCCTLFLSISAHAERMEEFQALTTWAEITYPDLFAPPTKNIQTYQPWRYTYYPETDTYIGINNENEIWVSGSAFGGLVFVDMLDNLVAAINPSSSNNMGGQCVNVPMIKVGSRIVSQRTTTDGSSTSTTDTTYTDISTTIMAFNEIVTSSIFGVPSRTESSTKVHYHIQNNILFLELIEATVVTKAGVTTPTDTTDTVKQSYRPALNRGPIQVFCENAMWTEPSVTETTTINSDVSTLQGIVSEGIVESIHTQVTVPAGTFTTVVTTTHNESGIDKLWIDIQTGHIVKMEAYSANKMNLKSRTEAITIE